MGPEYQEVLHQQEQIENLRDWGSKKQANIFSLLLCYFDQHIDKKPLLPKLT